MGRLLSSAADLRVSRRYPAGLWLSTKPDLDSTFRPFPVSLAGPRFPEVGGRFSEFGACLMKGIVGAVLGGLMTFGLVAGMAASLNLTSDSLGSATSVVAACPAGARDAPHTPRPTAAP